MGEKYPERIESKFRLMVDVRVSNWWRSVKRFRVSWGSKFALWWSPLQHSHTTVWACEIRPKI